MNCSNADWRCDLEASRDLSDKEKQHYGFLLAWYDSWRLRQGLEPDRAAAVAFWKSQVVTKPRKDWQLARWAEAMRWHGQRQSLDFSGFLKIQGLTPVVSKLALFRCFPELPHFERNRA